MEKRVLFRSAWLPWVLLLPQLVVISVFFFWPAGQALVQSFQMQDAFGMSTEWVGLENFRNLFEDPSYLASFKTTAFFSIAVAVSGIAGFSGFAYRWAVASGVVAGVASGFVRRFYSKPKGSDPNSRV